MSHWGDLAVVLYYTTRPSQYVLDAMARTVPGGSEIRIYDGDTPVELFAGGRLRDVTDYDSPGMLVWFLDQCTRYPHPVRGTLTIDIDNGPRYRYAWEDGALHKL